MAERVFVMLKPDGVRRRAEVLAILAPVARVTASRRFPKAPLRRLASLYEEHRDKPFYPWLIDAFRGRGVEALLLGPAGGFRGDLHQAVADLVGPTNPRDAAPGTVRSLSDDDMKISMREKRVVRNIIHRSRTAAESLREGAIFFFDLQGVADPALEPGPAGLALVDPRTGCGRKLAGIFFEERLADAFRTMGFLPARGRLTGYGEGLERRRGQACVALRFTFTNAGREERREVLLCD